MSSELPASGLLDTSIFIASESRRPLGDDDEDRALISAPSPRRADNSFGVGASRKTSTSDDGER